MEILDIEWQRCIDGYQLVDPVKLTPKEEKYFEARPSIDRSYWDSPMIVRNSQRMERYHPLKNVLFAVFAKWEPSPKGMVRFCDAYGPLIGMDCVNWMLDEQRILQSTLERLEAGDPVELIEQLSLGGYGKCAFILRQTAPGTLTPTLIPETLGQAMYIQLALHAASGAQLWSCEHCGVPFYVGTGTKRRSTAKYCSNACKVTAHKKRQQQGFTNPAARPASTHSDSPVEVAVRDLGTIEALVASPS